MPFPRLTRDPQRRGYREHLDALADEGVQSTSVGVYRVYDTRPLWSGRPAG